MLFMEKRKQNVKVNLSGNLLVASFELSDPPTVWQFDLEKNHSFTLSLKRYENGWNLGITPFGDEFLPIAYFENYDAAENALEIIKKLIIKRYNGKKLNYKNPLVSALLAMVALFFVLYLYAAVTYQPGTNQALTAKAPNPAAALNKDAAPEPKVGVPVPADELLKQ